MAILAIGSGGSNIGIEWAEWRNENFRKEKKVQTAELEFQTGNCPHVALRICFALLAIF